MRHQLPPLPSSFRILTAQESERLDSTHKGSLPKSLDDCITCRGKKVFRWYDNYGTEDQQIVEFDCSCVDQFIMHKYFLNAGVRKNLQRYSLGDCTGVEPSAFEAVADYVEKSDFHVARGTGLVFHGKHGTGKTLLMTILFKQLLAEGVDGYLTTFNQLLDNFAAGWRNDEHRTWFEQRVRNVPLLLVDDIGRENVGLNNMASSALDTVFRSRVQSSLPTLITTNLSMNEFERAYSTGVMGLVYETSLSYEFNGESFRDSQKEKTDREVKLELTRPITVS